MQSMLLAFVTLAQAARGAAPAGAAGVDDSPALERYNQAATSMEDAVGALAGSYARLEAAFNAWRGAEHERARLADDLTERIGAAEKELAARHAGAEKREARVQRRAELEALAAAVRKGL